MSKVVLFVLVIFSHVSGGEIGTRVGVYARYDQCLASGNEYMSDVSITFRETFHCFPVNAP